MVFRLRQLTESLTSYGPIDLIWFDVMLERSGSDYTTAGLRSFIHCIFPYRVINSRLGEHGYYDTPEQVIPVYPSDGQRRLCITTNNTWSYTGREDNCKTPYDIITMFC